MKQETITGVDVLASALRGVPNTLPDTGSSACLQPHRLPEGAERPRAPTSADLAQQLDEALSQIATLLAENARFKEHILSQQRTLAAAAHLALHDELTGLANRRLLLDRFQNALEQGTNPDSTLALVFLDLDGFKRVNDTLGHVSGDRLLRLVAQRLIEGIRDSDTACRFGGDEFVVLLTGVAGRDGAEAALGHINRRLVEPYQIDATRMAISASTGLAVYPFDGEDFDVLLQVSDRGMSRKKTGQAVFPRKPGIAHELQAAGSAPRDGNGRGK